MKFKIPCIHDTKGIDSNEKVADYHPLTLGEVSMLIHVAYAFRKAQSQKVTDIQNRLRQGILGMTCPLPTKGQISRRMMKVDKLFLEAMRNGKPPVYSRLALQLFENMMFETDEDRFMQISPEEEILAKRIEELELSVRAYNFLKNHNINTIGELTQKTEMEIFKKRYCGRKIISQIKSALNELGLDFATRI